LIFPQFFVEVSPYKDPVKIQIMVQILNKIITGFFVFIFGSLWFFSVKYYLKPRHFFIVVFDNKGRVITLGGLRTKFRTPGVAFIYIEEYQKRFPDQRFFLEPANPKFKRRIFS